jgi:hypothetical protein
MKIMFRVFTALLIALLVGCASTPPVYPTAFQSITRDELNRYFDAKKVGMVLLVADKKLDKKLKIDVLRYTGYGNINKTIGHLDGGDAFLFYLPEGERYTFEFNSGSADRFSFEFDVKGGVASMYKIDKAKTKPYAIAKPPTGTKYLGIGSVIDSLQIERSHVAREESKKPKFDLNYSQSRDDVAQLRISLAGNQAIKQVFINEVPLDRFNNNGTINLENKLNFGNNTFNVRIVNDANYQETKSVAIYRKTDEEKRKIAEAERLEKQRQIEAERQEKIRLANAEKARKLEAERIVREGDGTPDDTLCKKYGLRPQTEGYATCRMKLDFARMEIKREQERYEREKAAYDEQVAAIEKERDRQRAMRQLELGLRMMGGQSPLNALSSLGTGAPIGPPPTPMPLNQTIRLPNGRMVNCQTMGTFTNCF